MTCTNQTRIAHPNALVFRATAGFRFPLFVLAVAGASAYLFNLLAPFAILNTYGERIAACLPFDPTGAALTYGPEQAQEAAQEWQACLATVSHTPDQWVLGGLAMVFAASGLLYWYWPAWKLRRGRLVSLKPDDAPEVVAELEALAREVCLAQSLALVWDSSDLGADDLAFGRRGRYYLRLTHGLVRQYHADRLGFREIVRSELRHVRRGEVDRRYFALALWWTFVALFLLTALINILGLAGRG